MSAREERRQLNQHMHQKHHGSPPLVGDVFARLVAHEELHNTKVCDHMHPDMEIPTFWVEVTSTKKSAGA